MIITVKKYLNARIGKPSTNAPCPVYQKPGNKLEIDEILIGEELDGNAIWYHCKGDNYYYWSGGIEETEFELEGINLDDDQKKKVLNEAIKYYWTFWKRIIDGLTGIYVSENNTLVFQLDANHINDLLVRDRIPSTVKYKGIIITTEIIGSSFASFELICPGNTISRIKEMVECGTVGLKVSRREGDEFVHYLLTNYHVAAFDLLLNNQLSYKFPPDISNRQIMVPAQKFATQDQKFIGAFYEGRLSTFYDIALIKLNEEDEAYNTVDGFSITDYIDVTKDPSIFIGKNATLYGGTSGKQTKQIKSVQSHQVFVYSGNNSLELVELIQVEKFSRPGDSGSPVVADKKIIGIHVGGDDLFSYAIPIKRVLDFFNLKISKS